jgi:hypothetical protein
MIGRDTLNEIRKDRFICWLTDEVLRAKVSDAIQLSSSFTFISRVGRGNSKRIATQGTIVDGQPSNDGKK